MNRLFDTNPTLALGANVVGTVNSTAASLNTNRNTNTDIISALKDLKSAVSGGSTNVYNVNGVTYDDGSNITDAVKTLVRAAKVERRI